MTSSPKKLQVKLVKSPIGYTKKQRRVVQALGLRKIGQTVEHSDTPIIRGMVNKISHLLEITEINT